MSVGNDAEYCRMTAARYAAAAADIEKHPESATPISATRTIVEGRS
jgi:hypothetical protein